MTTDVVLRKPEMAILDNEQLKFIASTEFVPPGLRGNLPAILACVATGRALGIADMTALRSIHIIDGKATFSAELMVMLARQRGHSIEGTVSEGAARVTGKRADNGDTMTVEWTLAMAERAGLLGKSNWKKYPEAMLWARAISQLSRELFADCFAGATYTPEELEATAGVPTADRSGAGADPSDPASVPTPDNDDEVSTPAADILKAAEGLPPADLNDPDIPFGDAAPPEHQPPKPTKPMLDKLNVLSGKLRPDHCSTLDLWEDMAKARGRDANELIAELGGVGDDGVLHWSPLRDSLSKAEAHELIDRLDAFAKVKGL